MKNEPDQALLQPSNISNEIKISREIIPLTERFQGGCAFLFVVLRFVARIFTYLKGQYYKKSVPDKHVSGCLRPQIS
jgi:hypothetical protein